MNDLLNIELVNDSLKTVDQALGETLMALEKGLGRSFGRSLPSTVGGVDYHA